MTLPDYQTLMLPVPKIAANGETTIPAAESEIACMLSLTDAERQDVLPSGKQRVLMNRLHWARFYLGKAGLLESRGRGRFSASDSGRKLLENPPEKLSTKYLLSYPSFKSFYQGEVESARPVGSSDAISAMSTPEEQIDQAYASLQASLSANLIERIMQCTSAFFEQLIVDLLVAMGYGGSHKNASEKLGRSGDGGVDGIINEDALGLDRVYIQAKRYAEGNSIGRPQIQAFVGSLVGFGASKGVFVTTSTFSPQAREYVLKIPQRVVLIDGTLLTTLMISYAVGVRSIRSIDLMKPDEDYFSED